MYLSRRSSETDSAWVSRLVGHYQRNRAALSADSAREVRNWKAYSGVNEGQWDEEAKLLLRSESRPTVTINLIQDVVDLAYGILKQNPRKTRYEAMEPLKDGAVNLAQELFDLEADRGNWNKEEMAFIISGLVFQGVAQYYPDYVHSSLGNVGWRSITPWEVERDAAWQSDSIRECGFVYRSRFMNADKIASTFSSKAETVMEAKRALADRGHGSIRDVLGENGAIDGDYIDGDRYRVVELYFQEIEITTKVLDTKTGQYLTGKPQMVLDLAVEEDPTRFKKEVKQESVTRVVTFVPGLDPGLVLANGSYPFQLGHLPFQFWSAKNLWGERQGVVDKVFDLQCMVNKSESSMQNWQSLAANGSVIADANMFPDSKDRDDFKRDFNKPGKVFFADGGQRGIQGATTPVFGDQAPTYFSDTANRMMQYLNRIGGTDAPSNPNGSGNPMGANSKHYAEILSASFVKYEVLNQGLESVWAERAEAFIPAAQYIYAGPTRRVKSPKSPKALVLNQEVQDDNGIMARVNDIMTLNRYDFTIEMAKDGANKKQSDLNDITRQLQLITNPLLKSRMELKLVEYGDWSEADKEAMRKDGEVFQAFQIAQMQSQTKQMEQASKQADMALQQQAQGVPPGGAPQPPGGAKDAARGPGQGEIPGEAGIAGSGTAANNVQSSAPSDMNR